jgi:PEP-CTERM motif
MGEIVWGARRLGMAMLLALVSGEAIAQVEHAAIEAESQPIPEPSALGLIGAGLVALVVLWHVRRRNRR